MAYYNFKCSKCKKIKKDVKLSMTLFDIERKNVICCNTAMDRYFSKDTLPSIETESSPNRY